MYGNAQIGTRQGRPSPRHYTPTYAAASEQAAQQALRAFADGPWGTRYPTIAQPWQRAWEHVTPFFVFPPEIHKRTANPS